MVSKSILKKFINYRPDRKYDVKAPILRGLCFFGYPTKYPKHYFFPTYSQDQNIFPLLLFYIYISYLKKFFYFCYDLYFKRKSIYC